ncbi:MAG TPA: MmgE/PrpD family protein [Lacipirellulaceae bacterium]|jgi:2-methylcitrate dehydratase|nr:MmgE/PrpD family protein [Lacipirellulaceae bacterium]
MANPSPQQFTTLSRDTNQARGIAQYALDMVGGRHPGPSETVLKKVEQFHLDSIACGVSALAGGTNAPTVLRREALEYRTSDPADGVPMFGSTVRVAPEKAVLACSSAVREWDANGTNFGYNPAHSATAGEFGHNDFYPVAVAAAQQKGLDGRKTLVAMATLDEIRGRLAEVFKLNSHKIDHVVHGAIASAAVYGAVLGASVEQIESAIGLVVAHYIPFRAIRHGHQLSDSKGASAAISAEAAVTSVRRAMHGFVGPADIFRNPQAIFCLFEPPQQPETSPFDLTLATAGDDFAVMGMHFKLGIYEHQSAGAIHGVIKLVGEEPKLLDDLESLLDVRIRIYEPAFGIIGDPAKYDPRTRQSADHSMVYIVATLLRKAYELRRDGWDGRDGWRRLMLTPADYAEDESALFHPLTRRLMRHIDFRHGGRDYDRRYPDGLPTTVELVHAKLGPLSSGLVMYPAGHARCDSEDLGALLEQKVQLLAGQGVDDAGALVKRFTNLASKSSQEIECLYDFKIRGIEE